MGEQRIYKLGGPMINSEIININRNMLATNYINVVHIPKKV